MGLHDDSSFITNRGQGRVLTDVISDIMKKSDSLDILVGYFYFSGMKEIYQQVHDKKMRVLVGLEIEKDLLNKTYEIDFRMGKPKLSILQCREEFYDALVSLFSKTAFFESDASQEAFKTYYEKIKDGTLEIRQTEEPCHAKMYVFTYKDEVNEGGNDPGAVLTGSSNLTYSGLRGRTEINVRLREPREHADAEAIFESLWASGKLIANKETIESFEAGVIKHIWFEKIPAPYLMYLRALDEYFSIDNTSFIRLPDKITSGKFQSLKYQEDAIRLALASIEKHHGVIISDVVGLGKSIVASAIAHNLKMRTIIIAPPHLVPQWEDYSYEFSLGAKVFSRGKIREALNFYNEKNRDAAQWFVIVDEAHHYRNEGTKDYAMLHELCEGNKVALVSATPFNNDPSDIYALIKLFQVPTQSTLKTVNNLSTIFRQLILEYEKLRKKARDKNACDYDVTNEIKAISSAIRRIISPVVVRRSRLDLNRISLYREDLETQGIAFPVVAPPRLLNYELGDLSDLYLQTFYKITGQLVESNVKTTIFKAARYKPVAYVRPEYEMELRHDIELAGLDYTLYKQMQTNLAHFAGLMLVRRFESSQYAFLKTLDNMRKNCEKVLAWAETRKTVPFYNKGPLPDIEDLYDITVKDDGELQRCNLDSLHERGLFEIRVEYLKDSFIADLKSDIILLQQLQDEWNEKKELGDPKLKQFIGILKSQLERDPNRKVIVFSEFADTVNYIGRELANEGAPVFFYTSEKATDSNKQIIRSNFDASIDKNDQEDRYKILVATDAISEGYNLHRAGTIVNYDIPYNPTRVIQRVGRINRINKKTFDELYIYNYFPSDIGESLSGGKGISTLKMAMIHALLGEDTQFLTDDETPESYFNEQYKELQHGEEVSWDTRYIEFLNNVKDTSDMEEARNLPMRCKIKRIGDFGKEGILVFTKRGKDFTFKFAYEGATPEDIAPEEAFAMLEAAATETGFEVSDRYKRIFAEIENRTQSSQSVSALSKQLKEPVDKIKYAQDCHLCDEAYLSDLISVIKLDALPLLLLQQINRMKEDDLRNLPNVISSAYIRRILNVANNTGMETETLILSEELVPGMAEEEQKPGQASLF